MLASLNDVLPELKKRKLCLPAIGIACGQPDFLLGVLRACEDARCPALMLVWAGDTYIGLEACVALASDFAARSPVPVILHLDHAKEEDVKRALALGIRSVMFDGSSGPLDENIQRTRRMVALAHKYGACIEGELGHIGKEMDAGANAAGLTDPDEAALFVRETGVDLLAPAVGNVHGFTKVAPKLHFDLIERIAQSTGVPLSLHGGTGIPLADVRRAGTLGMNKINVASQLLRDYGEAIRDFVLQDADRKVRLDQDAGSRPPGRPRPHGGIHPGPRRGGTRLMAGDARRKVVGVGLACLDQLILWKGRRRRCARTASSTTLPRAAAWWARR